ncbi:hypothetical protein HYH03_015915 [Edaphochlamys debaryana]|uniref:Guanylate cyclase n=1 Tax=Edaphochlamys debaryana TaxID=47281 RepID=A0A835XM69_9CHLO|nr:hypothetical protein HYH03_015915 [Edaphochlamys debaryana]|eukprot:KAG2485333.1 hypothetical protein HYH03_015915 [Edaphochlamys debaryana]
MLEAHTGARELAAPGLRVYAVLCRLRKRTRKAGLLTRCLRAEAEGSDEDHPVLGSLLLRLTPLGPGPTASAPPWPLAALPVESHRTASSGPTAGLVPLLEGVALPSSAGGPCRPAPGPREPPSRGIPQPRARLSSTGSADGAVILALLRLGFVCLEGLPVIVTAFAADGACRYQNAASELYYGRRTGAPAAEGQGPAGAADSADCGGPRGGAAPPDADGGVASGPLLWAAALQQVFAWEPSKLEQLLETTRLQAFEADAEEEAEVEACLGGGSGGVWEGIVRVPASLNPLAAASQSASANGTAPQVESLELPTLRPSHALPDAAALLPPQAGPQPPHASASSTSTAATPPPHPPPAALPSPPLLSSPQQGRNEAGPALLPVDVTAGAAAPEFAPPAVMDRTRAGLVVARGSAGTTGPAGASAVPVLAAGEPAPACRRLGMFRSFTLGSTSRGAALLAAAEPCIASGSTVGPPPAGGRPATSCLSASAASARAAVESGVAEAREAPSAQQEPQGILAGRSLRCGTATGTSEGEGAAHVEHVHVDVYDSGAWACEDPCGRLRVPSAAIAVAPSGDLPSASQTASAGGRVRPNSLGQATAGSAHATLSKQLSHKTLFTSVNPLATSSWQVLCEELQASNPGGSSGGGVRSLFDTPPSCQRAGGAPLLPGVHGPLRALAEDEAAAMSIEAADTVSNASKVAERLLMYSNCPSPLARRAATETGGRALMPPPALPRPLPLQSGLCPHDPAAGAGSEVSMAGGGGVEVSGPDVESSSIPWLLLGSSRRNLRAEPSPVRPGHAGPAPAPPSRQSTEGEPLSRSSLAGRIWAAVRKAGHSNKGQRDRDDKGSCGEALSASASPGPPTPVVSAQRGASAVTLGGVTYTAGVGAAVGQGEVRRHHHSGGLPHRRSFSAFRLNTNSTLLAAGTGSALLPTELPDGSPSTAQRSAASMRAGYPAHLRASFSISRPQLPGSFQASALTHSGTGTHVHPAGVQHALQQCSPPCASPRVVSFANSLRHAPLSQRGLHPTNRATLHGSSLGSAGLAGHTCGGGGASGRTPLPASPCTAAAAAANLTSPNRRHTVDGPGSAGVMGAPHDGAASSAGLCHGAHSPHVSGANASSGGAEVGLQAAVGTPDSATTTDTLAAAPVAPTTAAAATASAAAAEAGPGAPDATSSGEGRAQVVPSGGAAVPPLHETTAARAGSGGRQAPSSCRPPAVRRALLDSQPSEHASRMRAFVELRAARRSCSRGTGPSSAAGGAHSRSRHGVDAASGGGRAGGRASNCAEGSSSESEYEAEPAQTANALRAPDGAPAAVLTGGAGGCRSSPDAAAAPTAMHIARQEGSARSDTEEEVKPREQEEEVAGELKEALGQPRQGASCDLDGGLAWHEVRAAAVTDPDSGARYLVVMQKDVTAKVEAERHIAQVSEAEHRLLEQIFPRHVLAYMTEEGFTPPPPAFNAQAEGADNTGGAQSAHRSLTTLAAWRPYVRDCTRLATWHPQVTVLFADIQGFTPMCKQLPPTVVMKFLNDLFVGFDSLLDVYGVYKVETIGDCYVVAGGLITEDADGMAAVQGGGESDPQQADRVFAFAQAMLRAASRVLMPTTGEPVKIRVGIHSGPVVSGVVGTRMPRFCLFGDSINTASRMESTSQPGSVHVSSDTYSLLTSKHAGWAPTGGIEVKGKGLMETHLWAPPVPTSNV